MFSLVEELHYFTAISDSERKTKHDGICFLSTSANPTQKNQAEFESSPRHHYPKEGNEILGNRPRAQNGLLGPGLLRFFKGHCSKVKGLQTPPPSTPQCFS